MFVEEFDDIFCLSQVIFVSIVCELDYILMGQVLFGLSKFTVPDMIALKELMHNERALL